MLNTQQLNRLKELTGATSYTEITKTSYKVYEKLLKYQEDGFTLCVIDSNGKLTELTLLM